MEWEVVIGLEVHIQLKLDSKLFSADVAIFGSEPNSNVGNVTLAHPGALPVVNKKAFEYGVMMGLACNCEITRENYFDRKHYFYPDLPKGYQVTQQATPVCGRGSITARMPDGESVVIAIHHIHLEEDAGKSIHDASDTHSLIDLNRAGVALLELVTEPVIHSPEEAYAFLAAIRRIVRYAGISDGNMEEGSLRCDANISLRKRGQTTLGVKTEVKNLNSMRYLQKALQYEIERQRKLLDVGDIVTQETRGYNSADNTTYSMREKESAHDYRYFPEPDIPPVILSDDYIYNVKGKMPLLPEYYIRRFTEKFGMSINDSLTLTEDQAAARFFDEACRSTSNYKAVCNWMLGPLKSILNENKIDFVGCNVAPEQLVELIQLVDEGKVNYSAAAQQILPAMYAENKHDALSIAKKLNLILSDDNTGAETIVNTIMESWPDKVAEFKKGKKGLLAFFIGEAMKAAKGQYKPELIKSLIEKALG